LALLKKIYRRGLGVSPLSSSPANLRKANQMKGMPDVGIPRSAKVALCRFNDHFKGFEKVEAVRRIFGEKAEEVLRNLKVEFFSSRWGYMGVSDEDGHLMVSTYYLKHGDAKEIYLDLIHELVHVKQFMDGEELFDDSFEYVDRPTEIEAYRLTIEEARRIGMSDMEIYNYLKVYWMSDAEVAKLAEALGVNLPAKVSQSR